MGVILSRDDSGNIRVTYPYNPVYVTKIKTIPGHRWYPEGKYWSFPYSEQVLNEILSAFAKEELLGHNDVSTTMIYTHVLNKPGVSVRSPLDG